MFADVLTLIADTPDAHGAFETPTSQTRTTVFVDVRSVSRTEAYSAMSAGLMPEFVFRIMRREDYNGEHYCEYRNQRFKVLRTYAYGDYIELTVERADIINE